MSLVEMVLDDARRMKTITHTELYRLNDAIFNRKEGDKLTSKIIVSLMVFVRRASQIFANKDSVTNSPHFLTDYRALLGTLQNQTTLINSKQQAAILQLLRDAIPAPLAPIDELEDLSGPDESKEKSAAVERNIKPMRRGKGGRTSSSTSNDWNALGQLRQQVLVVNEPQKGSKLSKGGKKEHIPTYGHLANPCQEPQHQPQPPQPPQPPKPPQQQWPARQQTSAQLQAAQDQKEWADLRRPYPGPESMQDVATPPLWGENNGNGKPTGQRHRRVMGNVRGTKKKNSGNNWFPDAGQKVEHEHSRPRGPAADEAVNAV
eukprot:GEMP01058840.1.p1 GENE.GEMP01058840.1~~GEMP01058840.1.p1  ORF type:complete len:318 (+),score=81.72 GEMP01058840.1:188-1141(+)